MKNNHKEILRKQNMFLAAPAQTRERLLQCLGGGCPVGCRRQTSQPVGPKGVQQSIGAEKGNDPLVRVEAPPTTTGLEHLPNMIAAPLLPISFLLPA